MVRRSLGAGIERLAGWTLVMMIALVISQISAQDQAPASVWDGVYSPDQAVRGEGAYHKSRASCHGEKLEGKGQTPPVAGSDFISNWNGMTVGDLLEKTQVSMPADHPGQLSKEQNSAIIAYIL
jgi:hypothetical protein